MADVTDSVTASPPPPPPASAAPPASRPLPVREDCWTEEASATLIEEWGRRYLELNRGNLRQKDWQEVADAVNALHAHSKKTHRTDVQCKNRLDTIKKKYKVEKSRVLSSNGTYVSNWGFFDKLDFLIGGGVTKPSPEPARLSLPSPASPPVGVPVPHGRTPSPATAKLVSLPQKRSAPSVALALPPPEVVSGVGVDEGFSFSRRNYSKMAAAAAAAEAEDEGVEENGDGDEGDGMRKLAKAIEGFVQVYERVEREKLKLTMEMEKQRMQFEKDLEMQRMQMFMDTQVQLERIKRRKPSGSD